MSKFLAKLHFIICWADVPVEYLFIYEFALFIYVFVYIHHNSNGTVNCYFLKDRFVSMNWAWIYALYEALASVSIVVL